MPNSFVSSKWSETSKRKENGAHHSEAGKPSICSISSPFKKAQLSSGLQIKHVVRVTAVPIIEMFLLGPLPEAAPAGPALIRNAYSQA